MKKFLSNNYILAVGEEIDGVEITNQEYNEIVTAMNNKPEKEGFYYKLRDDNKQWDEFEIIPDPETDLTVQDTLEMLNALGVNTDDK